MKTQRECERKLTQLKIVRPGHASVQVTQLKCLSLTLPPICVMFSWSSLFVSHIGLLRGTLKHTRAVPKVSGASLEKPKRFEYIYKKKASARLLSLVGR